MLARGILAHANRFSCFFLLCFLVSSWLMICLNWLINTLKLLLIGGWGCSTGKSSRFVRARVRAVWLPSGNGSECLLAGLFPFPFLARGAFPFPFLLWGAFPFPFPRPPNLLYNFSWAYRYRLSLEFSFWASFRKGHPLVIQIKLLGMV